MSSEETENNKTTNNNESAETASDQTPKWHQERAERNLKRALLLKKSKIVAHPYAKS